MKRLFFLSLIFVFLLFSSVIPVSAESEFELYLSDFYQKQEKARKYWKKLRQT